MEEWAHAIITTSAMCAASSGGGGSGAIFTLPSTWVVTMKLPFKTLGSIQRNVQQIKERLGLIDQPVQPQQKKKNPKTDNSSEEEEEKSPPLSWLDQMAMHFGKQHDSVYGRGSSSSNNNNGRDVQWNAQVVHLMANSDSERTLIATFFEK
jgi:hypothetical protein